ncbi:MAG: hypothetical protein AAF483_29800, partial [Planctomycetota bacterium]
MAYVFFVMLGIFFVGLVTRPQLERLLLYHRLLELGVTFEFDIVLLNQEKESVYSGVSFPSCLIIVFEEPRLVVLPDTPLEPSQLDGVKGKIGCTACKTNSSLFENRHLEVLARIIDAPFVELESSLVNIAGLESLEQMHSLKTVFAKDTIIEKQRESL